MSTEAVGKFSPCFSHVDFLHSVQVMHWMTLVEMYVNRTLMLMDCSGFDTLMAYWMKGHVLNREVVHLKVSGWLSDFTVLLTSELAVFLSPLKDARGGSENIWLVSGCFKNMT